jgi:hypothetical protein
MIDLLSLGVGQGDDNPEVLRSSLIFQKCAKLGRIFGEVEEADFDFAVETGGGNIDGVGDIGESQRVH